MGSKSVVKEPNYGKISYGIELYFNSIRKEKQKKRKALREERLITKLIKNKEKKDE